ncbi:MAG: hypothetical protein ACR2M5_12660 [Nakamurella sp.]
MAFIVPVALVGTVVGLAGELPEPTVDGRTEDVDGASALVATACGAIDAAVPGVEVRAEVEIDGLDEAGAIPGADRLVDPAPPEPRPTLLPEVQAATASTSVRTPATE